MKLALESGDEETDIVAVIGQRFKQGMFNAMAAILKGFGDLSIPFLLLLWAFDFLQILSLPFADSPGSQWGSVPVIQSLLTLLGTASLTATPSEAGSTYDAFALWAGTMSSSVIASVLFFWTVYDMSGPKGVVSATTSSANRWRIVVIRMFGIVMLNGEVTPPLVCEISITSTTHM